MLTSLLTQRIVSRRSADAHAVLQPIRVQTAQGKVEEALVHTVELGADVADIRATAVHDRDPMHTMMFTAQGTLLHANKAALESLCQQSMSGEAWSVTPLSVLCILCLVITALSWLGSYLHVLALSDWGLYSGMYKVIAVPNSAKCKHVCRRGGKRGCRTEGFV